MSASSSKHHTQGGVRKYLGGELNSPVAEWLNKGLMSASSPKQRLIRLIQGGILLAQGAVCADTGRAQQRGACVLRRRGGSGGTCSGGHRGGRPARAAVGSLHVEMCGSYGGTVPPDPPASRPLDHCGIPPRGRAWQLCR
eukprot:709117-Prorocentrum_minimum.AAC.1